MNSQQPRVLHLLQCTNLGGMEKTSAARMQSLANSGFQFSVSSPRLRGDGAPMFDQFDRASRYFPYKGKFNLLGHRPFANHVKREAASVDAVWITGTCTSAIRAALDTQLPIVLGHHFHHGTSPVSMAKWTAFYNLLVRRIGHVVYVSDFIREEAITLAPWLESRSSVARQSLATLDNRSDERTKRKIFAREQLGYPTDRLIVGNAGWLIPRKRFDVFVDVAEKVCRAEKNALFVICGDGPDRLALEERAFKAGLQDNILFRGWVKNISLEQDAWDIVLFNTDAEAAGRSVLEPMARGLPVVTSAKYGGLKNIVAKDRGVFYEHHDIEMLASSVLSVYNDQGLQNSMISASTLFIDEYYSEDNSRNVMRSAFSSLGI